MTRIKYLLLGIFYFLLPHLSTAQGIHYTPFYTTPTALNPAYAGMFDGKLRSGALFQNRIDAEGADYWSLGGSVDMPVVVLKDGSYIGAGVQIMKDQIVGGTQINFDAIASVSYHRGFSIGDWLHEHPIDIGVGLQAGFSQVIVGTSNLYFNTGSPFFLWQQYGLMNHVIRYPISGGISISQAAGKKFNYTLGITIHNVNTSADAIERNQNEALSFDKYFSFSAGANWQAANRVRVSPALAYMRHYSYDHFIGGCEFAFRTSRNRSPSHKQTSIFIAGWYRTGDLITGVIGAECRSVKLGIGCDYVFGNQMYSSGKGGYEVSLKYVAPYRGHKQPKHNVPCSIF